MDVERGSTYDPLREPKVGLELTKVRTPQDAVEFVERFGLPNIEDVETIKAREVRQPFAEIEQLATELRDIVRTAADLRAGVKGDTTAVGRLRTSLLERVRHAAGRRLEDKATRMVRALSDREILLESGEHVATSLEVGLQGASPMVLDRAWQGEAVEPGRLRIALYPMSLAGFCHLTVALALAEREALEICPECDVGFVIEDGRQKFCSPRCAARARFKRFKATRAAGAKGGRNATKTRKG